MGVESKSLSELIELISEECGAKYSCLAYADFLRNKALAEGTLQPKSKMEDYKFLMQLLSYNQTESKFHEEIGLLSFKDCELEDLKLQLKEYKQNSKEPKQKKIDKYEAAIADLENKISARIGKLNDTLEITTDPLLRARFGDYLATNTEEKGKFSLHTSALLFYKDTAKALQKLIKKAEFNDVSSASQAIFDLAVLAKRSCSAAFAIARLQSTDLNLFFTKETVIKEQMEHLFVICYGTELFSSLDFVDFILELHMKEINLLNKKSVEICKSTKLTAAILLVCCEKNLYIEAHRLLKRVLTLQTKLKQDPKQDAVRNQLHKDLSFYVEIVHRQLIISTWLHGGNIRNFTQTVFSAADLLLLLTGLSWDACQCLTYSNTRAVYLLNQILTNCIYGLTVCKQQETKNTSTLSDTEKEEVQKLTNDFSELGKKCVKKLNDLDEVRGKRKVQLKDFPSVSKVEKIVAVEPVASTTRYKKLFLLSAEIFSQQENFLMAGLSIRRFQGRYFDQEIKNWPIQFKPLKVELELEVIKLKPSLLDLVELFKKFQDNLVGIIIKEVGQKVFDAIGLLNADKEEELEQLVTSSKFVPEDHRLNVTKVLILGLNAKTGADWLIVARSVVAELEYCLRFWRNKKSKKIYLQDSFDHTEQLVHILGQKNVFYLQLLLCNKTGIKKQLFDLRNRLAHGDITESQAVDEEHNFKFVWHLFFHMVCEFIPEEGLNDKL